MKGPGTGRSLSTGEHHWGALTTSVSSHRGMQSASRCWGKVQGLGLSQRAECIFTRPLGPWGCTGRTHQARREQMVVALFFLLWHKICLCFLDFGPRMCTLSQHPWSLENDGSWDPPHMPTHRLLWMSLSGPHYPKKLYTRLPRRFWRQWPPCFNLSQTALESDKRKKVPNETGKTFRIQSPHYLLQPLLAVALT